MPTEEIVKKLQNKLGTSNDLIRCLLAEFIGTFVLVVSTYVVLYKEQSLVDTKQGVVTVE